MKKFLAGTTVGLIALVGFAPAAQASDMGSGNGYGRTVQMCLDKSVGDAITSGKAAHPGAKMTAKTIAESVHCAS